MRFWLGTVFGDDPVAAIDWLRARIVDLRGKTPLHLITRSSRGGGHGAPVQHCLAWGRVKLPGRAEGGGRVALVQPYLAWGREKLHGPWVYGFAAPGYTARLFDEVPLRRRARLGAPRTDLRRRLARSSRRRGPEEAS